MTPIIELSRGAARVRIAPELGARITEAELECADGAPLRIFHPYPESAVDLVHWAKGGLYPLIPYSGRIREARLLHEGSVLELTPHPGGEPHTLHGIAQQRPWTLEGRTQDSAVLRYEHRPDGCWPWRFDARIATRLQRRSLCVEVSITNADRRRMPAGIGLHPYFSYRLCDAVSFEAGASWPFDADFLALSRVPLQRREVTITSDQFEAGDSTMFYDDWAGEVILGARNRARVRMAADPCFSHLVVHRPHRADYVCIEPVSHVADGFNLHARGVAGTGTRLLAPGQALHGSVRITCDEGP